MAPVLAPLPDSPVPSPEADRKRSNGISGPVAVGIVEEKDEERSDSLSTASSSRSSSSSWAQVEALPDSDALGKKKHLLLLGNGSEV